MYLMRSSTHKHWSGVTIGDRVYDVADERHIGRITKHDGAFATIEWEETGWKSTEVPMGNLRKIKLMDGR